MSGHGIYLVILLFVAIALLIVLINWKTRFHPVLALLTVSFLTALAAGEELTKVPETVIDGAGGTLGDTGLVVALGAVLGKLLADSGAVGRIADLVVEHSTPRSAPWIMTAVSFVIGIPMFFEVGLVVMLPVIYSIAVRLEIAHNRPKMWYLRILIPAIAALSCLHGMVPPHPGPLIAVEGLHADTGLTIALGLLCAVPTVILAGPVYAQFIAPRIKLQPPANLVRQYAGEAALAELERTPVGGAKAPSGARGDGAASGTGTTTPGSAGTEASATDQGSGGSPVPDDAAASQPLRRVPTWLAFVCILVPVVLMLVHTVVQLVAPDSAFEPVAEVLGNPVIAMLIGVLFSMAVLSIASGIDGERMRKGFGSSLSSVAGVILIIGAGGAFNQVLKDSGIGDALVEATSHVHMNLILLGWIIGIVLSFATGSATVGIVSATGILAPLVAGMSPGYVSLVVIAIGSGSIGLNWVNHAGFWFVKEAFGMTLGQATKTHMMVQTLVSVFGLACALLVSLFV